MSAPACCPGWDAAGPPGVLPANGGTLHAVAVPLHRPPVWNDPRRPVGSPVSWPAVSVVMPVLNEERHLEAAVRHVLAQDYPGDMEVVLGVGPSEDRTREVADALAAADPRVVVVDNRSEEHTSELQSREKLVCRRLLEKKKTTVKAQSYHS